MTRALVAVLSDPHLSVRRAYCVPAWRTAVSAVAELAPALTVVAGDLVLDDCDDADDRAFAVEALAALSRGARVVPGNHDLGDNVPDPWMGQAVTEARLEAYLAAHGSDRFVADVGDWRFIGLNSQIFGTGLPREVEQWAWLAEAARDAGPRPIALVLHKPLAIWGARDAEAPGRVAAAPREMLRAAIGAARLRLVVSGHYHHHRAVVLEGVTQVWLPSTALVGRKAHGFGAVGIRSPGFVAIALDGEDASFAMVDTPAAQAIDPEVLGARHGAAAPRDWPELREAVAG